MPPKAAWFHLKKFICITDTPWHAQSADLRRQWPSLSGTACKDPHKILLLRLPCFIRWSAKNDFENRYYIYIYTLLYKPNKKVFSCRCLHEMLDVFGCFFQCCFQPAVPFWVPYQRYQRAGVDRWCSSGIGDSLWTLSLRFSCCVVHPCKTW